MIYHMNHTSHFLHDEHMVGMNMLNNI